MVCGAVIYGYDLSRIAAPDPEEVTIDWVDDLDEDLHELALARRQLGQIQELGRLMDLIPPMEADCIDLHMQGVSQDAIGAVLGMTQAAVAYRLSQAYRRLRWLAEADYLSFDASQMREDLAPYVSLGITPKDIDILVVYFLTTNQSHAALAVKMNQSNTRNRVRRAIKILERAGGADRYVQLFRAIQDSPNMRGQNVNRWAERRAGFSTDG